MSSVCVYDYMSDVRIRVTNMQTVHISTVSTIYSYATTHSTHTITYSIIYVQTHTLLLALYNTWTTQLVYIVS